MNFIEYIYVRRIVGIATFVVAIAYILVASVHTYAWWSGYATTNIPSVQLLKTLFEAPFVLALLYAITVTVLSVCFLRRSRWNGFLQEGVWVGGLIGGMIPLVLVDFNFIIVVLTSFETLGDGVYGMVVYAIMLTLAMFTLPSGIVLGSIAGAVLQRSKRLQK